jgi:molybdopterin converting factor small subunit
LLHSEVAVGTINHNAVIASTWDKDEVKRIEEWIESLECDGIIVRDVKSRFVVGPVDEFNAGQTIVMLPDGSKEGWGPSDWFDALRDQFIEELDKVNYEDGSSPWKYVEVGYGEFGQKLIRGNNVNCYSDAEIPKRVRR